MADYFSVRNQPILNPPSGVALGSATNQYQSMFVASNLVVGNSTFTSSTLGAPKIASIAYPGNDTAADIAGGQTITLTGSGFLAGAGVIINGVSASVVTVVNSITLSFTAPALATGSYPIYVVNTDGGTAIAVPGIQYSGTPAWSTAAGSLGSVYETKEFNSTVTATGDAPITYSLQSGTLPTGANLNSNGTITGTSVATASPTTYTFTIRSSDAQNQDTDRQFSLTVNPDVVTWSAPANNTVYSVDAAIAISTVTLSANSAAGYGVVYTANTLPTGLSLSGNAITGIPTVVGNVITALTATANTSGRSAVNTVTWVITVGRDLYFPSVTTLISAQGPTSTFITDTSTNAFNIVANGDARPNNFNPYTPGYYSNYFSGSTRLTTPSETKFAYGTGNFTIESWIYPRAYTAGNYAGGIIYSQAEYGYNYLMFYIGGSGEVGFIANGTTTLSTAALIPLNQWTHIAVVREGTGTNQSKIYINGTSQATGTTAYDFTNISSPIGIGSYPHDNTSLPFNGFISNLRVSKGIARYTGNFTPSTNPFTADNDTSLLTCQSNRFIDESSSPSSITVEGAVEVSSLTPFVPSSNYADRGSGYFDGGTYRLQIADDASLRLNTGSWTVEAWIYLTGGSYYRTIVAKRTGSTPEWDLLVSNTGYLMFYNGSAYSGNALVPLKRWVHAAATYDGTNLRLFQNGVVVLTQAGITAASGTAPVYIGNIHDNGEPWYGYISNVRVIKGTALYTSTFTLPSTPLTAVANTSLLTLQNNQPTNNNMFLDASTNNFNITRNGNTTQGTFSPYGGGWSNYFNGSTDYFSMSDNNAFQYGAGDFALECWVYPTAALSGNYIVSQWYTGNKGVILGIAGGSLSFYYSTTGSNDIILVSATNPALNQWSHLLACRTGNTISVYLNGTRVATTTESGTLYNSTSTIGIATHVQELGSSLWPGYISNLRSIAGSHPYNAAQTTITVPTAPLTAVANTRLLICADNRFIDDGPSNFTLTRAGTPSVQRFNPFNPVTTTPTSYSAYFDGTGDYLTVPTNSAFAFGSGSFTIEAWIYPLVSATEMFITTEHNYGSLASHYFRITSGNLLNGIVYINNTDTGLTSDAVVPSNQWSHVVFARSSNTLILGLNGVVKTTAVNGSLDVPSQPFNIGRQTNDTKFFNGYISNLRVVKGTAVYTTNFTPSTTPLSAIANTSLLTLQSATFTDTSANAFAITANGDAAPRQFNPFGWTTTTGTSAAYTPALYGGSGYFDGTGDYLSAPDNTELNLGSGDYTIEGWWYFTDSSNQAMVSKYTANNGYVVQWQPNNLRMVLGLGSSDAVYTFAWTPVIKTWNHVAITRSGTNGRAFVNGVQIGSTTTFTTSNTPAAATLQIGSTHTVSELTRGYVSDVRIIKGVALYTSNFAPPVAPLTARTNTMLLAGMSAAGIYDSSLNSNFETVGDVRTNTSVVKFAGKSSTYFDGTGDYLLIPSSQNFTFGTGDFTIEFWLNTSSTGFNIVNPATATGTGYWALLVQTSNLRWNSAYNVTNLWLVDATSILNGQWNHVAVCRNAGVTKAFFNGTVVATNADTTNYSGAEAWHIGSGNVAGLNGYLNDFRITRGVARYTTNFTPPTQPFKQF